MFWTLYNFLLSIVDLRFWKRRRALFLLKPLDGSSILIHAVSLGEAKGALELICRLRDKYPHKSIVCTVWTKTGYHFLKKEAVAHQLLYFPVDTRKNMRMLLHKVNPDLAIIVENDLWPNFLRELKKKKITTLLVNGKISTTSFHRYQKFRHFNPFQSLDFIAVQNKEYAGKFSKLGVDIGKIVVTGNLKFDLRKKEMNSPILSKNERRKIIAIVSTHDKEEELLLRELKSTCIGSNLIFLAPRHPERFDEVERLLQKLELKYTYYAEYIDTQHIDVVLVNRLGVLESIYPLSKITIVGGSFCKGYPGHNIYEPLQYGSLVLFGPYMDKQKELESLLADTSLSSQVPIDTLSVIVSSKLQIVFDQEFYEKLQGKIEGALEKTERIIKDLVQN